MERPRQSKSERCQNETRSYGCLINDDGTLPASSDHFGLFGAGGTSPTVTVSYEGNGNTGGSAPTDPNGYHPGQTVVVLANNGNLAKTGFVFMGWNTQADCGGGQYTGGQTFTIGSANVALYAGWSNMSLVQPSAAWSKRSGFPGAVFNNLMWIAGGYTGNPFYANDVWYSSDGISWTAATPSAAWSSRYDLQCVVFNNELWVIGGTPSSDVWHSANGISWTLATSAPPWQKRSGHSCVVFDNKIWLIGGYQESAGYNGDMNDVWSSPDGANWTLANGTPSWSARSYPKAIAYNGKMWILGGSHNPGTGSVTSFNDVWSSTDGTNWTLVLANAPWQSGYQGASFVYDNKLCVTASSVSGNGNDQIWSTTDGANWTLMNGCPGWAGRMRMACMVYNSKM